MDDHNATPTDPDSATEPGTPPEAAGDDNATAAIDPAFALVEIEYQGRKWLVPKDRGQWDMNVQFEFEDGNRMRGLMTLLAGTPDPDVIQGVRAQVYAFARTNREVDAFMNHVTEVLNKQCTG